MRIAGLAVAALVAIGIPNAAAAQRVVADIRVQQGPVSGRVVIGDRRPSPRTVVVAHPYRTVTVYRVHRGHGWYEHRGFRRVRVWYDARSERYYDRYDRFHPGLREVVVYERGGEYYRDYDRNDDRRWNDDHRRNDDHGWDDRDGRHNDRD